MSPYSANKDPYPNPWLPLVLAGAIVAAERPPHGKPHVEPENHVQYPAQVGARIQLTAATTSAPAGFPTTSMHGMTE
jgi:hypothetical protein